MTKGLFESTGRDEELELGDIPKDERHLLNSLFR